MTLKIIAAALILIIFLFVFIRMLPKNDNLHKNLRSQAVIPILVISGALVLISAFFLGREIIYNSTGPLHNDSASKKPAKSPQDAVAEEPPQDENDSADMLVITVSLDKTIIDDKEYSSPRDASGVISDALAGGKGIRLIDDYALAATYNDLMDMLLGMNINRSNIEEIKTP